MRKMPWRRKLQPTTEFLPGKSHGQRSPAGCSPWAHKQSDKTEQQTHIVYVNWKLLSHIWLFATPRTVACQAPMSLEFFRQGYWSGLPGPAPGDPPYPEIESEIPALQANSLSSEPPGKSYISYILVHAKSLGHIRLFVTLWAVADRLLCPWDSSGKILEWVAISFSRGSSWPRNQTHISYVSCIGRLILYLSATWEAL